jgi:hypothetical protein
MSYSSWMLLNTPVPNGVHQVLVTELVHSLDFARYSDFRPTITLPVVHQVIKGLALIHRPGHSTRGCHISLALLAV